MSTIPIRARLPEAARKDFLDALSGLRLTAEQERYVRWACEGWDQPTLNAFADIIRVARTST